MSTQNPDDRERARMAQAWREARAEAQAYYLEMVPPAKREGFSGVAKSHFPELVGEINKIKAQVDQGADFQKQLWLSRRYLVLFKDLARKTMIKMISTGVVDKS